ncbi:hypothetical protein [Silicimonas algicola]|uniref:hypothetical protein n=1 Tax=Silicimonas algicola TaxID=1826607 RepID=UPI0019D09A95|nr:hypothetical protein [Silicimonas algicola]
MKNAILKHLPRCGDPEYRAWQISAMGLGSSAFLLGHQRDVASLESLRRHLQGAISCLEDMQEETRTTIYRSIEFEFPGQGHQDFKDAEDFVQISLVKIRDTATGLLKYARRYRIPDAKERRNWEAAAVAHICRNIWESETGKKAPTSQRFHGPGPFGRFLEEVLEALEFRDGDGNTLRAATALRSLSSVPNKDQIER